MKVILQENIASLGDVGDVLNVADGYARNFLLPRKKALAANPRNIKALEHVKRMTAHKAKKLEQDIRTVADTLSNVSLAFPVQTGKDDKLFGAITARDIEARLVADGFDVNRRNIHLAQPLKELGTFPISIKLHQGVTANISVSLVKRGEKARDDDDEDDMPIEETDETDETEETDESST